VTGLRVVFTGGHKRIEVLRQYPDLATLWAMFATLFRLKPQ
jgi:hypothetical protein